MTLERQLENYGWHLREAIDRMDVRADPTEAVRPITRPVTARYRVRPLAVGAAAALVVIVAATTLWTRDAIEPTPVADPGLDAPAESVFPMRLPVVADESPVVVEEVIPLDRFGKDPSCCSHSDPPS